MAPTITSTAWSPLSPLAYFSAVSLNSLTAFLNSAEDKLDAITAKALA
ncbi:hypothetical protein [Borreliella bavariensis]|nr:hypothetical protein [Borreliella bavariensis]